MTAWTFEGDPVAAGGVTLVEGSSFSVSDERGDIAGGSHGVFFRDTRILSRWRLLLDEEPVEPLSVVAQEPYAATFLCRVNPRPGRADATLVLERHRYVGGGMREDLVLRNYAGEAAGVTVTIEVDADFADLFEVKAGRRAGRGNLDSSVRNGELQMHFRLGDRSRSVRIQAPEAIASPGRLTFRAVVPPRGSWSTTTVVVTGVDGREVPPRFPAAEPVELSEPAERMTAWREGSPRVRTPYTALARALKRSEEDLGALRIQDPDHPDLSVVAAGAPWFMTLFGRDSLIASWMMLPFNRALALNTVRTLARYQGRRVDPMTEEQPGRILHEMRFGVDASLALGGGNVYYGTADATPLFVVLLGELSRWGVPSEDVLPLLSNADRALEWVQDYGDLDGDGFVEYARLTDRGLRNQGWKDSFDGINYADGRLANPPIALAEVQGYVYAAYIARAHFAREVGDETGIRRWRDKARALKEAFNEQFWLPERGWYAVALGPHKQPVDALASNIGHCLWSGIVDEDKAAQVAEQLMSPEMFTGFGIRTLASSMGAYNPVSYHNGSVWPHDSALAATGLLRYGFADEAVRIATGLLDAAEAFGGRLPELFCGFGRDEYAPPVRYPTSCSPQAWASATPVQLLRLMLRLDPGLPEHRIWLDPVLPDGCRTLHVENLRIADAPATIDVRDGEVSVTGLPDDIEVIRAPRDPVGRIIRTAS